MKKIRATVTFVHEWEPDAIAYEDFLEEEEEEFTVEKAAEIERMWVNEGDWTCLDWILDGYPADIKFEVVES